jgi:hypothetical protein
MADFEPSQTGDSLWSWHVRFDVMSVEGDCLPCVLYIMASRAFTLLPVTDIAKTAEFQS